MADVTELLHSARRAVEAGDYRKALPLLEEAVKLGPNLFGVQLLRGLCLTAVGYHAEAVQALQRAVDLNPTSAQGHYNLAVALGSAKRQKDAEQHFRQALRLQPGYEGAEEGLRSLDGRATIGATARTPTSAVVPPPREPPLPRAEAPRPAARPERAREARPAPTETTKPRKGYWKWAALVVVAVAAAVAIAERPSAEVDSSFIVWQAPGNFAALDFSPDGQLLAAAGEKVTLWRVTSGVLYRDFTWGEKAEDLAFSPSGTALAVSSRDEKTGNSVKLWRMPDSGLVAVLPPTAGNRPLVYSPDGKLLAIGTDYMSTATPLGVQLWSMPERKVVGAVTTPDPVAAGYITAIAFSPDSKLIASADDSGTVWISSVPNRRRLQTIPTDNMMTISLAFSPSGKTLAYAGSSGPKVVICSAPDGKPLRTLEHDAKIRGKLGLAPAVNALAFSPDGSLLATCEGTGDLARIELFSVSEGQLLKTLDASRLPADPEAKSDSPLELRDIHFSRDGKYLAWCGSRGVTVARVADLIG